ncbi:hypothetical protein TTHERM_00735360 (macronuclear) [Tetrahymena thermophila SB210]|uniref:Uncharacterized protein n=1 Tax=Tetrahymena thermophila (strain SB210) TaxID=312017 RepID=Q231W0_TETTS|nr:hypothetical protein TTHERM_00735360 [Tetrahymena thermophila SB210]EAR91340.1 hypothetical protein TTHERM_00735360 [Tetrahymena thermophila SB210]|eukprot:XP_001011585.1 hypothetical protein TTHERM_00735360 [Tetrahymena thermophila SB210]
MKIAPKNRAINSSQLKQQNSFCNKERLAPTLNRNKSGELFIEINNFSGQNCICNENNICLQAQMSTFDSKVKEQIKLSQIFDYLEDIFSVQINYQFVIL